MMMRAVATSVLLWGLLVQAQECPPDIGTSPDEPPFGNPIPPNPEDIPAGCSDFEILIARGTSEPGKFGYRVGDPVVGNVTEALPGARGYPAQYPASSDFEAGVEQGGQDVADRVSSQATACPEQKFSLVGYSQGAMVMRRAIELIPESLFEKIGSVVFFGDPRFGEPVPEGLQDKVLENCATGDQVCDDSGASCQYAHISYTYPEWIDATKDFIVAGFTA